MTKITFLMSMVILLAIFGCSNTMAEEAEQKVVIMKLDDLMVDNKNGVRDEWKKLVEITRSENIKITIGVIGKYIAYRNAKFYKWVKEQNDSGFVEFWNHGYLHTMIKINGKNVPVFKAPIEKQKKCLKLTQEAAEKYLGFKFKAFGSPFNAINLDTAKVLVQHPEINTWIFGNQEYANKENFKGIVLRRPLNMEYPVGNPNFDKFKQNYSKLESEKVITLQGHPQQWSKENRFEEFAKIVKFLKEQGWVFKTFQEYYSTVKDN